MPLEEPLEPERPEPVDHVATQSEGHDLGSRQQPALFEGDAEVDVHQFAGVFAAAVEQEVLRVSVADAEHVAHHAGDGERHRVEPPRAHPARCVARELAEELSEHGLEVAADVGVDSTPLLDGDRLLGAHVLHLRATRLHRQVSRSVEVVSAQPPAQEIGRGHLPCRLEHLIRELHTSTWQSS